MPYARSHLYDADEAFAPGSFGGLTPICSVDGRGFPQIMGPIATQLREAYLEYAKTAD